MYKQGVRWQVLGARKVIYAFVLFSSFILHPSSFIHAQHIRLYACVIGSDAPGASMGGSSIGSGLWQSDDTAKSWKQIGWKHVKCYSVDVVHKSNGKIIYEACGNGVLRSTDAGATWRMLTDWRITEVMDIVIDQKAPKNIYIATPEAIWKSMDGGDTWFEADTDIPHPLFVSRIKIDSKDHLKIYAATETGIYISKDGGLNWVNAKAPISALHNFIIDDTKALIGVDSIGIVVWRDTTHTVSSTGHQHDTAYHESPLYPGVKGTLRFYNGKTIYLPETPKNIYTMISIASILFIGSLDGGIWKYDYNGDYDLPVRTALDSEQVWRLKAVEVK
jgi:hypothetical protein